MGPGSLFPLQQGDPNVFEASESIKNPLFLCLRHWEQILEQLNPKYLQNTWKKPQYLENTWKKTNKTWCV